jgi:inorganic pyrophosphatase
MEVVMVITVVIVAMVVGILAMIALVTMVDDVEAPAVLAAQDQEVQTIPDLWLVED